MQKSVMVYSCSGAEPLARRLNKPLCGQQQTSMKTKVDDGMNNSKIMEELKDATLFELYRLSAAISQQLEDPKRIGEVSRQLRIGQIISYFDSTENRAVEAKVIKLKRTRLLVETIQDKQRWDIPFYWVNVDRANTEISTSTARKGVDKSQIKVGDTVGFQDRQNNDVYGEVIRLNQKTATIVTNSGAKWRVAYAYLNLIIDGEQRFPNLIEGEIIDL